MLKGTHCTTETRMKMSEAKRKNPVRFWLGKSRSEATRNKISKALMGKPTWNKGKKGHSAWNKGRKGCYTEESLRKMSEALKGHIPWNKGLKGRWAPWNKGLRNCYTEETLQKMSKAKKGRKFINISLSRKKLFKNPAYKEKIIKATLKGLLKRPTSLEKMFMELIRKYNLPFAYCGNGILLIGYKNPDFYETNGKKICIEVANRYHHPDPWAEKRIEHFTKYGWKCLVLFEDELNELPEEEIVRRVKS